MVTLIVVLGMSFLFGLVFTPVARELAKRLGLVDQPDGRRKSHARPVPLAGGIAVFAATGLSVAVLAVVSPWLGEDLARNARVNAGLLAASCVVCGIGLLDDLHRLRGRQKLFGQLCAVLVVWCSGVEIRHISVFGWHIEMNGLSALAFTTFWLLGAMNSLNLIDGMDGLLATVAAIICLALAVMAALISQIGTAAIALALAGALCAFLFYNCPPASVYLGDCGSLLVGLVVGVLAINGSLKGPATVALATPVVMLTIPILDTLAAIVRRKLTGRSLYTTDRGHIHHCLLRRGFGPRYALVLLALICIITVGGALASVAFNNELLAIVAALFVVVMLPATGMFGQAEYRLLKDRTVQFTLSLFSLRPKGAVHEVEVRLQGCADWQELWRSLTSLAGEMNLQSIRLDVNAPAVYEGYHARWQRMEDSDAEVDSTWRTEIPLIVAGHHAGRLEVIGFRSDSVAWKKVARLAKLAEEVEQIITNLIAVQPPSKDAFLQPKSSAVLVR